MINVPDSDIHSLLVQRRSARKSLGNIKVKASLWGQISSASAVASTTNADAVSISGFKDLGFGMTHSQLREIGVDDCEDGEGMDICRLQDK